MSMIKNNFFPYLFGFIMGGLIILFSNIVINHVNSLRELYSKTQPVINDISIIETKVEDNLFMIHITGKKVKNNCGAPLKIDGYYGNPLKPFEFVDTFNRYYRNENKQPYTERPVIPDVVQDFGWWVMRPIPSDVFYLYIDYLCESESGPYINKTVFGPFEFT